VADAAEQPTWIHLLVADPGAGAVLAVVERTGPARLPAIERDMGPFETEAIAAAVISRLGGELPILRIAPVGLTWEHRSSHVLVELEPPSDLTPPAGCGWLPLGEALAESLGPPEIRPALERSLAEQIDGRPLARRPRWSRPGFLARARGWMSDRLAEAGTPAVATPRLHQLWGLSAILRADTSAGAVFLKSCAAVFADEPAITAAVGRVDPGAGPTVVARDDAEGWLLMRDVGGDALGEGPIERWPDGLVALGALQRAWLDSLAAIPLEDRGPEILATSLPALVEDPILDGLPDDARRRLRDALPRLDAACHRLAGLGPGPTIVHGDFHPWNVHRSDDRIAIIDWSDSCLGHPFLDLVTYVGRTTDVSARRAMVAGYLDGWSVGFARDDLEEAARLALPLGAFHQVESYRRIVASLEPDDRWDLESAAPSYARAALGWLEAGLATSVGA